MACKHISCSSKRGAWLPLIASVGFNAYIKKHPYCKECGTIKNIIGDKARTIGYYTDVLTAIREYTNRRQSIIPKLTETQVRLIAKELESNDLFKDTYGTNLDIQKNKFIEEVRKYRPDLTEDFIKNFL
ncbi:MAG: hypothetical protein ACFFDN_30650 [Candidatus Hodarchaeota archaeon]